MKFRIKHADQVVGAFVVLSLVALVGMIVLLGMNQRWFAKNYLFRTEFPSGGGLSTGMPITMKGFQVGQIESVRLNERDTVDVEFVIYDTYIHKVKKYSVIELSVSPIGLGGGFFFYPGRGDEPLEEGAFIPRLDSDEGQSIYEQELADIPPKDDTVTRLVAGINPLLDNVNKTVVSLNRTLQEINRAMIGQSTGPVGTLLLDAASAMSGVNGLVADARGSVDDIMRQVNEIVAQVNELMIRLDGVMTDVGGIAANVEKTTAAIADPTGLVPKLLDPHGSIATILNDGNALYESIQKTLKQIEATMANLVAISGSLVAEMPKIATILNESKNALTTAQDVLTGLKNNPLLSGGIPTRTDQTSIYSSIREGEF